MKKIITDYPGGLPFFEEELEFLQKSFTEPIDALVATGTYSPDVPVVLSGMSSSAGVGVTNVAAGVFAYQGKAIRFDAQSYAPPGAGNDIYVVLNETILPRTFESGAINNVIYDVAGVLTELTNTTAEDATKFKLSSMVSWGVSMGRKNRPDWVSVAASGLYGGTSLGVTGTIAYRIDQLASLLHLKIDITIANSAALSPTGDYEGYPVIITGGEVDALKLPYDLYFSIRKTHDTGSPATVSPQYDTDGYPINNLRGMILKTHGSIAIYLRKASASYSLSGRWTFPLD